MLGIEAEENVPADWSNHPTGRLMIREGQTGDRLITDAIEPFRRQPEVARSERPFQGVEAFKSLSHLAAETRGADLRRERFKQILLRLAIGLADLVALGAKG